MDLDTPETSFVDPLVHVDADVDVEVDVEDLRPVSKKSQDVSSVDLIANRVVWAANRNRRGCEVLSPSHFSGLFFLFFLFIVIFCLCLYLVVSKHPLLLSSLVAVYWDVF